MMKLLETFEEEHRLIDQVIGSFRTWVDEFVADAAASDAAVDGAATDDAAIDGAATDNTAADSGFRAADGQRFLEFFVEFVGGWHDHREEQVLFETLIGQADLPRDRGPVHALVTEHAEMNGWLQEITAILQTDRPCGDDLARLRALAVRFSQTLWLHIDAENSVLYPESTRRLRQNGVRELPEDIEMTEAQAAIRADGAALAERYPPTEDDLLVRGEGCFMCRAYGVTCEGLEAEWWSELEWDDFFDR